MPYVKVENGVVVMKSCSYAEGLIEADDSVACGFLSDGTGFKAPPIVKDRKAEIIGLLSSLDLKRIRPLAEGDSVFLEQLNTQIAALRQELASLQ